MSSGHILWHSLLVFAGVLALVEQTKAPLYALVLFPTICMIIALSVADVLEWGWSRQNVLVRLLVVILSAGLLALVLAEGVYTQWKDLRQAAATNTYLETGRRLNAYLSPRSIVLGTDRWWWALHNHSYLSVHAFFSPWRAYTSYRNITPVFAAWVTQRQINFIIVDGDMRGTISRYPDAIRKQFLDFLQTCSVLAVEETDAIYGQIEMYQIVPSAAPVCRS